jgi:hypothetical protein
MSMSGGSNGDVYVDMWRGMLTAELKRLRGQVGAWKAVPENAARYAEVAAAIVRAEQRMAEISDQLTGAETTS